MVSILVGTSDFRAALASVLIHACTDKDLPALARIRLDVGPENVTVTATDRFSAGLAIVSVHSHLAPELEAIDLTVDDAGKILALFKAGPEKGDEPQYLLRIDTTGEHVTITDSSGMIDGRALQLPRLDVDDSFTDVPRLFARSVHSAPILIEDMTVNGKLLARFKTAAAAYQKPVIIEARAGIRSVLFRCGESFLGALMPVPLSESEYAETRAWAQAWTRRLTDPTAEATA
ncbi:hypothetical protein G4X40_20305 [Rhodococcus sp. D2-41]|uniref:hypothetical protein n=1 Tax=Speluncibacter jeojiensis TaxID=2710754 RepID=UPI00241096C8|nr:hypothetical protein [Rhodococcus sp. D2-41]MDG3012486.1 hypothetical protein [Rhodococcus sp. D2-41]